MSENLMTVQDFCHTRNISRDAFYNHKRAGRLKGCFRRKPGGKRQLVIPSKADKALSDNVRYSAGGEATRRKFKPDAETAEIPETQEEIRSYLDESIGNLAALDISELQRRNELEKLLMAQIKRRQIEGGLVERESMENDWKEHIITARQELLRIPDACGPVLADYLDRKKTAELVDLIKKKIRTALESFVNSEMKRIENEDNKKESKK